MAVCVLARDVALNTGQALLQKKYMVSVNGSGQQDGSFGDGKDTMEKLYRLLEDDPHTALNVGQTATCSPIQGRSGLDEAWTHCFFRYMLTTNVLKRSLTPLLSWLLAWYMVLLVWLGFVYYNSDVMS